MRDGAVSAWPHTLRLADGSHVPRIGFGTNSSSQENHGDVERAVLQAIDAGFRYFDTSRLYWNEAEVGRAIKTKIADGRIKRSDLWLTSKIWCTIDTNELIEQTCRESLATLQLDSVDLCLMHIPSSFAFAGDPTTYPLCTEPKHYIGICLEKAWKAMERLIRLGLTKHIGVANASVAQLEQIIATASIKPATNHIECCPGMHQKKTIKFCRNNGILVTAYCPLGRQDFQRLAERYNNNGRVLEICQQHGKTSKQLILRYMYQMGTVPVPKPIANDKIEHLFDIFDFELDKREMGILDAFYIDERQKLLEAEMQLDDEFPICLGKIRNFQQDD